MDRLKIAGSPHTIGDPVYQIFALQMESHILEITINAIIHVTKRLVKYGLTYQVILSSARTSMYFVDHSRQNKVKNAMGMMGIRDNPILVGTLENASFRYLIVSWSGLTIIHNVNQGKWVKNLALIVVIIWRVLVLKLDKNRTVWRFMLINNGYLHYAHKGMSLVSLKRIPVTLLAWMDT